MLKPKVVVIIQARMGSTRLPGKVLMPAAGKTLLAHLVERLRRSKTLDCLVIATSVLPSDDAIVNEAQAINSEVFRGSEADCLDRYVKAGRQYQADIVVRITADCPLIDHTLMDEMVVFALNNPGKWDLVTNRHPLTFPDGLDVDVIPMESLEKAAREAKKPHQREHTIPYFWEGGMRVFNFEDPDNLFKKYRWTLDYKEDYEVIRQIFDALYPANSLFLTGDILRLLESRPDLISLNSQYIS